MTAGAGPLLIAAAWVAIPLLILWRARHSRSLDEESARPPADPPLVSVIIPARDEARNIERCARSALSSDYPALEVLVVDDHSRDGTGDIARAIAREDPRLRVVAAPDLPVGWFGKPWACAAGARAARGELLLFADADTTHAPDLVTRLVNAAHARGSDLISVAGTQELGSFWERVVQPQVFAILLARYGGSEHVERSPRVADKIANGQCLAMRRTAYERVGGHGAVRHRVAEDLMLAQETFRAGMRVSLVLGERQLSTRMYTSLRELVRGWGKNVYAGGIDAMPFGAGGRLIFPVLLLLPPLLMLIPPIALIGAALGIWNGGTLLWSGVACGSLLVFWAVVHRGFRQSALWAVTWPLGAAVLLWIMLVAIARGRRVMWKGRHYVAASD